MDLEGLPPVGGLMESSLAHWDGRVVAVVFLQGCNFACPSCPVPNLVPRAPGAEGDGKATRAGRIPLDSVLDAVFSRRHLLDGVVVTGGEPTLHESLPELLEVLRHLGLPIRLHTNGTRPRALERVVRAGLAESVALTLRGPLTALYPVATGVEADLGEIFGSVELLLREPGDHEFRLVVDPWLLTREDVARAARTVAGARRLVLCPVRPEVPGLRALRALARLAGRHVEHCTVAGEPGRDLGRVAAADRRARRSLGAA